MLSINNPIKKTLLLTLLKSAGLFTRYEAGDGYILNPKFVQFGTTGDIVVAAGGYTTRAVTFPVQFDTQPVVIPINRIYGLNSDKAVLSVQSLSSSQCTFFVRTMGDAFTTRLTWIAINAQFVFK
jgi:hypothetical protein